MATSTSSSTLLVSRFDSGGFRPHFGARAAAPVGSKAMAELSSNREPTEELRLLARAGKASSLLHLLSLRLVRNGKYDVDELGRDQRGVTLLMIASQAGHHETVTVLLQMGASTWTRNKSAKSVIFTRARSADANASPRRASDNRSLTELRYGGMCALHFGAWSGSAKTVAALCSAGQDAPIRMLAADDSSVLHCAIAGLSARKSECLSSSDSPTNSDEFTIAPLLQQLISFGADINTACSSRRRWCSLLGRPCRHLQSRISRGLTPLHCAVDAGDVLAVTTLLAAGCDVDARTSRSGLCDKSQTALHFACEQLHVAVVRVLLDAGASPRVTDNNGATPMHLVFSSASDLFVNTFGMCGAVVHDIETLDNSERSLIAKARTQIVQMLLDGGVDRFVTACHSPTDDPATRRSALKGNHLTVANMASVHLDSGGSDVLRLLGTCFAQPRSLKNSCRLAVRKCLKRPLTHGCTTTLAKRVKDTRLLAYLLFEEKQEQL